MRRDRVVDTTRYGLDGPGIEIGVCEVFHPVQNSPEAHLTSNTMVIASFSGVKRLDRGFDHPTPSSAEVKEGVDIYLFSTSGRSWPVVG